MAAPGADSESADIDYVECFVMLLSTVGIFKVIVKFVSRQVVVYSPGFSTALILPRM